MNKIYEWFTRKRIIVISLILTITFIVFGFILPHFFFDICKGYRFFNFCLDFSRSIFIFLFICLPILIFSVITFFLKDRIFYPWKKFTLIYLFTYLFIYLFMPLDCRGWSFLFCKEQIYIIFISLYSVLSLLLILIKSFKKEKEKIQ